MGPRSWVAALRRDRITTAEELARARGGVPHVVVGERRVWVPPGAPVRQVGGDPSRWWPSVLDAAGDGEVRVLAGDAETTDLVGGGWVDRTRIRVLPLVLGAGTPVLPVPSAVRAELLGATTEGSAVVLEHRLRGVARSGREAGPSGSLAEFLLARVAEDERAAVEATGARWVPAVQREPGGGWTDVSAWLVTVPDPQRGDGPGTTVASTGSDRDQNHVVRWDPARVLADCAVRRRLVQRFADVEPEVLAELAEPWRSHPDHRPEWRPQGGQPPSPGAAAADPEGEGIA
nr:DUF6221 family protein [Auraticoccus cholistanensis]